ncbi:MAG: hypothetical protein HN348_32745, partial [Proteobacteria bacterium]|nr:hypothetical protein [Pseudomonadota bacterium]
MRNFIIPCLIAVTGCLPAGRRDFGEYTDETQEVDCETSAWYADADKDGFGNANELVDACDAPSGYVSNGDDCDDGDKGRHPGALETCNNIDDNCNGKEDENATDVATWYADLDGDGFGDPDSPISGCDVPGNANFDNTDCDDSNGAINPAAPEVCNGEDDDCSGTSDDNVANPPSWYHDADGDGYGSTAVAQCTQPSGYAALPGDCDNYDSSIYPGAPELCDGQNNDCDLLSWSSALEAGLATIMVPSGKYDITSDVTGTSSTPVQYQPPEGTLTFCDGTFHVSLELLGGGSWTIDSIN